VTRSLPFDLRIPSGWDVQPFGRIVERSQEVGRPDARPLSVFLDQGVVPRDSRDDNFNRLGADLAKYLVVQEGDIVFNKLRTWQGGLGVSKFDGIVSPAYFVCRPHPSADTTFLHYLLRSHVYLEELTRISKWMPPSQFDIAWDDLRSLPILLPPPATQRAIAAFLDREAVRIDALIAAKRRLIQLLALRALAMLDAWVQEKIERFGTVPLRRLLSGVEQGWSPECDAVEAEPEEWGVLKTSAVSSGVFRPEENKRLPPGVLPDLRWAVADGDLLVIRGSGSKSHVGQTAVAHVRGRRLLLSDLIYRLRLHRADADFVAAVMRSNFVRGVLEASIRSDAGQTLKVRGDDLRVLPIPAVPNDQQHASWLEIVRPTSKIAEGVTALESQINVVTELRQALITEAVSGKLQIPGAES